MAALNRVMLMGNLTRGPSIRHIPSGTAVADIGLAINERLRGKKGEETESSCFVDVVAWDRLAENCGEYLSKGSPVLVEGSLQMDQWTNKNGEKRSKIRIRADRVQFLGKPKNEKTQKAASEES